MSIVKKLLVVFGVIIFVFVAGGFSCASEPEISVYVDGVKIDFPDQKPYIDENGRTLVPVRFISEALGANVTWNKNTNSMEIKNSNTIINLSINEKRIIINGQEKSMDTKAVITKKGRTMVPVRFISEAFGLPVGWDSNSFSIYIGKKPEKFYISKSNSKKLSDWKVYYPFSKEEDVVSLAYGNGTYVAVTNSGWGAINKNKKYPYKIYTSADGKTWTFRKEVMRTYFHHLKYINGEFISLPYSENDKLFTSPDGVEWSEKKIILNGEYFIKNAGESCLFDIAYGNSKYVGVGGAGSGPVIYFSDDRENWEMVNMEPLTTIYKGFIEGFITFNNQEIFQVIYGNDTFVAAGTSNLYGSKDGKNWTRTKLEDTAIIEGITYGNGIFLAVGWKNDNKDYPNLLYKSTDGEHWTKIELKKDIVAFPRSITYGNGTFVIAAENGPVAISNDGQNWTKGKGVSSQYLGKIIYGKNAFVGYIYKTVFSRGAMIFSEFK